MKPAIKVTAAVDVIPPADMAHTAAAATLRILVPSVEGRKNRMIVGRPQAHIACRVWRIAPAMNPSGVHPGMRVTVSDAMPPMTAPSCAHSFEVAISSFRMSECSCQSIGHWA
jgi:hypothetical protein